MPMVAMAMAAAAAMSMVVATMRMRALIVMRLASSGYLIGSNSTQGTSTYCSNDMSKAMTHIFTFLLAVVVNCLSDARGCYRSFG